jgi:glycosyltransferase involved in cell wall biosynthesis
LIRTVSVVIPTRNSSSTIAAAVGCARGQVGVHVECLVVDDSSDDTRAVAVEAGAKVVPGQGRGVSAARNLGASVASGEFVAFLDADDQWAEDKLARQIALLDSDSALAMVGTQFRITGGIHGTRELRMSDAALRRYNAIEYLASPRLPASVFLVRTAVAQQVRFPVGISDGEDTIYAAEVRIHGLIGCVEEVLMTRHLRAGSLSNSPGHVSKNFLARLSYLREHWQALGAADLASAERTLVETQVEDAWAYYWRGDFENFRVQRQELRQAWPSDIPLPDALVRRTWPEPLVRLRRLITNWAG